MRARIVLWVLFAHFAFVQLAILVGAIRSRNWPLLVPCVVIVLLSPGVTLRVDELLKRAARSPRRARRRPLRVPVDAPSESAPTEPPAPSIWPLLVALGAILVAMAMIRWAP